jgi:hypothetical protein
MLHDKRQIYMPVVKIAHILLGNSESMLVIYRNGNEMRHIEPWNNSVTEMTGYGLDVQGSIP